MFGLEGMAENLLQRLKLVGPSAYLFLPLFLLPFSGAFSSISFGGLPIFGGSTLPYQLAPVRRDDSQLERVRYHAPVTMIRSERVLHSAKGSEIVIGVRPELTGDNVIYVGLRKRNGVSACGCWQSPRHASRFAHMFPAKSPSAASVVA